MREAINYAEPWMPVDEHADNLVRELQREVREHHPLWGRKARAIAQRTDSDDVLFELEGAGPKFAVVHLTWTGQSETRGEWPATRLFSSIEDWLRDGMMRDHKEFIGSDGP